tara:strand:- start:156 stop:857 length:702 start_codon:yes stop_codon:yes gene_type:complete
MGKLVKILESVLVENITEQITMDDGSEMSTDNDLSGSGMDRDYAKLKRAQDVSEELVLDGHLRNIFKQMKKISNLEEYYNFIENNSEHFYYYSDVENKKWRSTRDLILRLPRFFGAQQNVDANSAVTMLVVFLRNGGYSRDFSKGTLDLSPLITYDVDSETVRDTVTHESSYGEVFADSPEEAIQKFKDSPDTWISDAEHEDTEYGDYKSVENVSLNGTNKRYLTLGSLGFKI